MMASIGGQTFSVLNIAGGASAFASEESEDVTRPGTDGEGKRIGGRRSGRVVYEAVSDFSSAAGLRSARTTYGGMRSTVQTLVDSLGNSYQVWVEDVEVLRERRCAVYSGGGGGPWELRTRWTVEVRS